MKKVYNHVEIWFAVGSQDLYGEETLRQVAEQSKEVGDYLDASDKIPAPVVHKGTLKSEVQITQFFQEANSDPKCAGVILWMHTFSPSKMWINGLKNNTKPLLHLHTQFHRDIPWDTIDMDFMNLNQSAHGGREHGFINSRLRINRKVVVGHWQETEVLQKIGSWVRAAVGALEMQRMRVCRFGDNMREVAVTEGDKVAAQVAFGFDVYGYGVGDLAQVVEAVTEAEVDALIAEYEATYELAPELKAGGARQKDLRVAARLEAGMEKFLVDGNFTAFTTTFEDLHGIAQLPGLACQRLMEKGYGFAAEGDWKTAALLRLFKIMGKGLDGGSSFMEDYTYNLDPSRSLVLGSHMLEVCPTVAGDNPVRLEIHPLGIGGKEDPVRMVFQGAPGAALNATVLDMGNRFRLLINEVEAVTVPQDMPNLPVSGVVWDAKPSLKVAAEAWIVSGGAHHTAYSRAVTTEMLRDYADICDIEIVVIDKDTKIATLKEAGRWNDLYYAFRGFPRA